MRTKLLGIGFIALLLVGVSMTPASAHRKKFNTRISIDFDGANLFGTVSSRADECVSGRSVTVFQVRRGPGDRVVGSTTTNVDGDYVVPSDTEDGLFYAVVSQTSTGGYGHLHTCKGARSATIKVGQGGVLGIGDVRPGVQPQPADGEGLAVTGADTWLYLAAGLALIGMGGLLVRRNRRSTAS